MYSSRVLKQAAVRGEPIELGRLPEAVVIEEKPPEEHSTLLAIREREAYEKGFQAGEKAGFDFGKKKAEVLFSGLEGVLNELGSVKEDLFRACEKEMTSLCVTIAKKAVQRELEAREDGILDCLRAALKAVIAGGEITIRVNPKEFEIVKNGKPELARFCAGVKGINIEADEAVARGGCLVSTNYGEIDYSVGSILQEIEEKLAYAYSRD